MEVVGRLCCGNNNNRKIRSCWELRHTSRRHGTAVHLLPARDEML